MDSVCKNVTLAHSNESFIRGKRGGASGKSISRRSHETKGIAPLYLFIYAPVLPILAGMIFMLG